MLIQSDCIHGGRCVLNPVVDTGTCSRRRQENIDDTIKRIQNVFCHDLTIIEDAFQILLQK